MTMVKPHLFIPGPTNIPDAVRMAMNLPMEDMRSPEFPKFTLPIFEDLKKVFKMKDGRVFIFPSSGTGAWESAITNTLAVGDKVLMSRFGQFSLLWVDMAERMGLKVELCDEEWGTGVPLEKYADILAKDKNHEIKAVFATHNETATGVSSRHRRRAQGARRRQASRAAVRRRRVVGRLARHAHGRVGRRLLRLGFAEGLHAADRSRHPRRQPEGARRQQEPQRPHEPLLLLLRRHDQDQRPRLLPLHAGNAAASAVCAPRSTCIAPKASTTSSRATRALPRACAPPSMRWGLKLCAKEPKWHSDTVSAILVPEGIDANNVLKTAYYRYNTSLGTGLNKVAGKVFRIGHLGALDEVMIGGVLFAVEMALQGLRRQRQVRFGHRRGGRILLARPRPSRRPRPAAEGSLSDLKRPAASRPGALRFIRRRSAPARL